MNGKIFRIVRGSTEDGAGLRTVVYLSGCGLNCAWCQNPEGKRNGRSILYYAHKCTACGACVSVCAHGCHTMTAGKHRFDRERCVRCGACASDCVGRALVSAGDEISCERLVDILLRDTDFYKASGGGVTFSGGECVLQNDFMRETLRLCKRHGLHTTIETALFYEYALLQNLLPYTDCVLADIKHSDSDTHKRFTGYGNERILQNFRALAKEKKDVRVRCAVIPHFNDTEDVLRTMAQFVKECGLRSMELLNFNDTIPNKYNACGQAVGYFGKAFSSEELAKKQRAVNEVFET